MSVISPTNVPPTSSSPVHDDERSIADLLRSPQFDPILPSLLSFLSVVELLYVQGVNKHWQSSVAVAQQKNIKKLHLGQFWSRLGILDISHFLSLVVRYRCVKDLNLSYCHFMKNQDFLSILTSIPNYTELERINLFYCYQLTDEIIEKIFLLVPRLKELNLGRVANITDNGMIHLSKMKSLRSLNIIQNANISEESIMIFDDPEKFPALQILNIVNCNKFKPEMMDELRITRGNLKIIGPQEVFTVDKSGKKLRRDVQDT